MSSVKDISTWLSNSQSVAASISADAIFGVFKRTFDLPAGFAAMSVNRDDAHQLHKPGGVIDGSDLSELLIFRSQPIDLQFELSQFSARDNYLCDVRVSMQVSLIPEKTELESFRDRVMGSRTVASVESIASHFRPAVEKCLRAFVADSDSAEMIGGRCDDPAKKAIEAAIAPLCFASGLAADVVNDIRFFSEARDKVRLAEQQAVQRLEEHEAQSELREAIATAQGQRLDHLQDMLTKLRELSDNSPSAGLSDLMKAFTESQRGQMYQALFDSRAKKRATQWLVVVTSDELLFFDTQESATPARRIKLEGGEIKGNAGRLRSVQLGSVQSGPGGSSGSKQTLLVGAARGVYEVDVEHGTILNTFVFEAESEIKGGVNAVAANESCVVATHSEKGVILWHRDEPDAPKMLFADAAASARAVRCAQFGAGRFWCSIDNSIYSLPEDNMLTGEPMQLATRASLITALAIDGDHIFAGTAEGDVLHWSSADCDLPQAIHAGSRRAVESIEPVKGADVSRLFFTDTSLAVFSRVLGDSFTCRYEAGGQTIRRATCATDIIAATNDARDRVFTWDASRPNHPSQTISIAQLTGHSTQDLCLVPMVWLDNQS